MSERGPSKPNWRDSWMLRRIGNRVLWLPEDEAIDTTGKGHSVHVLAHRAGGSAAIQLSELLSHESDGASQHTSITITEGIGKSARPSSLSADRFIDDDMAAMQGITPTHQEFTLGDPSSTLSLSQVMRSVCLATRIVADAETIKYYLAHPEHHSAPEPQYPQTF